MPDASARKLRRRNSTLLDILSGMGRGELRSGRSLLSTSVDEGAPMDGDREPRVSLAGSAAATSMGTRLKVRCTSPVSLSPVCSYASQLDLQRNIGPHQYRIHRGVSGQRNIDISDGELWSARAWSAILLTVVPLSRRVLYSVQVGVCSKNFRQRQKGARTELGRLAHTARARNRAHLALCLGVDDLPSPSYRQTTSFGR